MNESRKDPDRSLDFALLLRRCADKAYNFAYRLCGNDQDAQDMVQEAFARGFAHRDRYDPNRPFEAWIMTILKNVYLDNVRRYEHKHKVSLDAPLNSDEDAGRWEALLPGKDEDPLQSAERGEDERMVQRALERLPVHYRSAVVLYDIEGFSYEEVSRMTDSPLGTVCSRIHKGRQLLKKALQELQDQRRTVLQHG
ncbi:MAG: sigma-70 family RNA polymerase sigma factor [Elusimicrobia bacterium]|nr:sigma-70 family RNA polymerase sigma factor [Elusimicrobiota bacterium]